MHAAAARQPMHTHMSQTYQAFLPALKQHHPMVKGDDVTLYSMFTERLTHIPGSSKKKKEQMTYYVWFWHRLHIL